MKRNYRPAVLFLLYFLVTYPLDSQMPTEACLILNVQDERMLPKRFRLTTDSLVLGGKDIDVTGFKELHASASGQFSAQGLQLVVEHLKCSSPLYIVDLRQESHGFMNGMAVSWYAYKDFGNKDKSLEEIQGNERNLLCEALRKKQVTIEKIIRKSGTGYLQETSPFTVTLSSGQTEEDLVSAVGLHYTRIPVTDHMKPSAKSVDMFIQFVRNLPRGAWVHFHCSAGAGRSTTFLTMYDMMHNAKKVSLENILARQILLGGIDFHSHQDPNNWKYAEAVERLSFIKQFYQYCLSNESGFQQTWTSYASESLAM